jgi:hypothetical protein
MPREIKAIKGFVKSTFFDAEKERTCNVDKKCPIVTVSRGYGAQGRTVSKLLSDQLTVDHFDSKLVDNLIKEVKTNKHLMAKFDEKFSTSVDDWVYSFISGTMSKSNYYQLLIKTVTAIAETGGVILGRGAHLILSHHPNVFRLRVEGSLESCARRISIRESIDLNQAKKLVKKTDKDRIGYVKEVYKQFPSERSYYDMSVCSDHLDPHDIVDLTINAMKKRGLYVPGSD